MMEEPKTEIEYTVKAKAKKQEDGFYLPWIEVYFNGHFQYGEVLMWEAKLTEEEALVMARQWALEKLSQIVDSANFWLGKIKDNYEAKGM